MARYKHIDTSPRFLAVDLQRQLLPGTLEHAMNHLIDRELDLSGFDTRFKNDLTGATVYPPAMLLKVVLFAYSMGIVSSRNIERMCRDHVIFIALSGDSGPHFTTLAGFVSTLGDDIARIFSQILFICDQQGLIGREMFAIDGVKLPSNAAKAKSGTRADFEHQAAKLEAAAKVMLERHREEDQRTVEPDLRAKEIQRIAKLENDAAKVRHWLTANPEDRKGSKGAVRKSNRTDNESAKMATSKGVIQGYTGVAAVDAKQATQTKKPLIGKDSLITADAGYRSEDNLKKLATLNVDALIADNAMRGRDERFAGQDKYKALPDPLHDKGGKTRKAKCYQPEDFAYDPQAGTCICPAGKPLYGNGSGCTIKGKAAVKFKGAQRDCEPCTHREPCLRTPHKTKTRQVTFIQRRK